MSTRPDLLTRTWSRTREAVLGGHTVDCRRRACSGIGQHPLPRCHYCQRWLTADTATVDHVVPVALGGDPSQGSVVPACRSCNAAKGARFSGDSRFADPHFAARTAVRRWGWE